MKPKTFTLTIFLLKAENLLPSAFPNAIGTPKSGEYEIVLAIVSKSKNPLKLPFFSRVNLNSARTRLQNMGYVVSLGKIQAMG